MSKFGPGDRVYTNSGNSSKQSGVTSSTAQTTRRHHHPQQQGLWIAPGVTTSEVWSDLPQRIAEGGYRVDSFSRPLHQPHHANTSNVGMYCRQPPPAYDPYLPNPTTTMPVWPYQTGPSSQPVLLRNFNGTAYTTSNTSSHHHQLAPSIVNTTHEHQQQRQRRITQAMYWITASLLLSANATALLLFTGHKKYSSSNLQSTTVSPSSIPLSVSSRASVTGDDVSSSTYYYYHYPNKTDDDAMSAAASWKTNIPTPTPQQQKNLTSTRTPTIIYKPTKKAALTPSIVRDSNVQPSSDSNVASSSMNATLGNITASENAEESISTNSTNSTLESSIEMTTSNDDTRLNNSSSTGNASMNETFNYATTSSSNDTTTSSSLPTNNTTKFQGDTYYYYTDTTRKDDNSTKPPNSSTPTSNATSSPADVSSSFTTAGTASSSSTTNSNDDPFLNGGKPIQSLNDDQPNDDYSNLLSTANEIQINPVTGNVNSVDDTTNTVTASSSGNSKADDDPIMAYQDYKAQTSSRGNSTFQGYDDGFDDTVQDDAFKVDDTWANQKKTAFGETITGQSATEYLPQQATSNFDKNKHDDTDDAFKK